MTLTRLVPPAAMPVSLEDAKSYLRVTSGTVEDASITAMIRAATTAAETFLRRVLVTQTWRRSLRGFYEDEITLPLPPVQAVTAVRWFQDGNSYTLAPTEYEASVVDEVGVVRMRSGKSWPSTDNVLSAAQIEFIAGYGAAADVPGDIVQAIYFMIGHFYRNREAVVTGTIATEVPLGFQPLLYPYMYHRFV